MTGTKYSDKSNPTAGYPSNVNVASTPVTITLDQSGTIFESGSSGTFYLDLPDANGDAIGSQFSAFSRAGLCKLVFRGQSGQTFYKENMNVETATDEFMVQNAFCTVRCIASGRWFVEADPDYHQKSEGDGSFERIGRLTQASGDGVGASLYFDFDLYGDSIQTLEAGQMYFANVEIIGVSSDGSDYAEIWSGKLFYYKAASGALGSKTISGHTISSLFTWGGTSPLLGTPSLVDDGSGNARMKVVTAAAKDANWVMKLSGLHVGGDQFAT